MKTKIILAGATGWVGKSLAVAIHSSSDLELAGAVAPHHAQQNLGTILNIEDLDLAIASDVTEALLTSQAHVFIDFTTPSTVKQNVMTALNAGLHVIIGTSGLTEQDYVDIDSQARRNKVGAIAAGNFSLTAALMKHFAIIAARFIPEWEIIDYASAKKPDAPSGTARELAEALSTIRRPVIQIPIDQTVGSQEARGGDINGTRVHSIRLPGHTLATQVTFGMPDEKLTIYHEAGSSPVPYIQGVLLAVCKVSTLTGLVRGLDQLLEMPTSLATLPL